MITRVKIDGYKSFKNFELEMKELMVIVGPNASGKSNLLDALQLVSLACAEKSFKESFESHRGLPLESISWPRSDNKDSVAAGKMKFEIDVKIDEAVKSSVEKNISKLREGLSSNQQAKSRITESNLRYNLEMEVMRIGETRVIDESLKALTKRKPYRERRREAFFEKVGDVISLRMEGQARPRKIDLGIDHTIISEPLYAPHYPHISAFREELSRWRFYYLDPKTLMREDSPIKPVEVIGSKGEQLAGFFFTLQNKDPKTFENIKKSLKLILPGVKGIGVEQNEKEGTVRLLVNELTDDFHPKLISEGTLRVLGLLAIFNALTPPSLVGFEEPENGVHPDRLKIIADILKHQASSGIQVIVNSHSPEFVEYFDEDSIFICSKDSKGTTKIKPLNSYGPIFKRDSIRKALRELSY